MATVYEFRNGEVIEHTEDLAYIADAWAFAEAMNQVAREWYRLPLEIMEGAMWMRDQKNRDERNVIHAAERFTTERRIETRRFSGMATRVIRRRRDDDGPDSAA